MKMLIAIPARYASQRLPGKPLLTINGKTMLQRVYEIAQLVAQRNPQIECIVATEDQRILDYCQQNNINCLLTADTCRTGTDRIQEVIARMHTKPEFVVNLQGDNPLCPPWIVEAVIQAYLQDPTREVVTPCVRLSWAELAQLEIEKHSTPFSGTTAIVNPQNQAIWFSKNIIPAIRNKAAAQTANPCLSPVLQHIGLYGYRLDVLNKIATLQESYYEQYEALEQLRFLENAIKIHVVMVDYRGRTSMSGVDAPADIIKAEQLLNKDGEFI